MADMQALATEWMKIYEMKDAAEIKAHVVKVWPVCDPEGLGEMTVEQLRKNFDDADEKYSGAEIAQLPEAEQAAAREHAKAEAKVENDLLLGNIKPNANGKVGAKELGEVYVWRILEKGF